MSDIFQTDKYIIDSTPVAQGGGGGGGGDLDDYADSSNAIDDADKIVTRENADGTWYKKTFAKLWEYIKSKLGISTQGSTGKYLNEQGTFAVPDAVRQYPSSTNNANYRVLLSNSENDTDETSLTRKDTNLTYNPSTNQLNAEKVNGVAKTLARSGNLGYPMTFNWSGQNGQPNWLWGGNDGTNNYVYNPSNFSVAKAAECTSLNMVTIYSGQVLSSAVAGTPIAYIQNVPAGTYIVFFSVKWSQVNVWFHLKLNGANISDCVGGAQGSSMALGTYTNAAVSTGSFTCDTQLSNHTVVFEVRMLKIRA